MYTTTSTPYNHSNVNVVSGRVARAGRSGSAYSLVSSDEVAYMLDLHLFLGQSLRLHGPQGGTTGEDEQWPSGGWGVKAALEIFLFLNILHDKLL